RSRAAAVRWHGQLLEDVRSLENNPERCGLAPESEWYPGEIRQLLHGKRRGVYRVLFEVRGKTVYILRVRHSDQTLLEPGEMCRQRLGTAETDRAAGGYAEDQELALENTCFTLQLFNRSIPMFLAASLGAAVEFPEAVSSRRNDLAGEGMT